MMTERNDGGPAFPITTEAQRLGCEVSHFISWPGMTLRDWIAGQCLAAAFGADGNDQLILLHGESADEARRRVWGDVAKAAFIAADAFIAARDYT